MIILLFITNAINQQTRPGLKFPGEGVNMYHVMVSRKGFETPYTFENYEEAMVFLESTRNTFRRLDPDGVELDVYILSDDEVRRREHARRFYDSLTAEQKADRIVVGGKTYIRAIYERNHA